MPRGSPHRARRMRGRRPANGYSLTRLWQAPSPCKPLVRVAVAVWNESYHKRIHSNVYRSIWFLDNGVRVSCHQWKRGDFFNSEFLIDKVDTVWVHNQKVCIAHSHNRRIAIQIG